MNKRKTIKRDSMEFEKLSSSADSYTVCVSGCSRSWRSFVIFSLELIHEGAGKSVFFLYNIDCFKGLKNL